MRVSQRMTYMSGQPLFAGQELTVADDTAAHAGRDGDEDHLMGIDSQSVIFGPGRRLRIVHRQARQSRQLLQRFPQGKLRQPPRLSGFNAVSTP